MAPDWMWGWLMNGMAPFESVGRGGLGFLTAAGEIALLFSQTVLWALRPPYRPRLIFQQMEFVGVKSLNVVILTGSFVGAVFSLQSYYGFSLFGAESLVGSTVALALARELAPVITSLMIIGRAGSAMAAELGTMKVTEQVDALMVMAVNPIQYLVVPRVIAGIVMLPFLTILANFVGILGGYLVGVYILGINSGMFIGRIIDYVDFSDLGIGLVKSAVFGLILSLVGCHQGLKTTGGAEGVGKATTQAVVVASVLILVTDYFLTALLF
jgi:phospholipid/cholesterol/gamma-HCH transport system permease protein